MKNDLTSEKLSRRKLLQTGAAATAALTLAPGALLAADKETAVKTTDLLATLRRERPRLLAAPGTWDKLKAQRGADALLDGFLKRGEVEARAILAAPPVTYEKLGKRLLGVSRTVLRRVLLLAMHFHLTGDTALAKRAQDEMLAAAAFTDWNPSHFLDTAEMTTALAIGYDWLHSQLDPAARQAIAAAIVEKGLRAGAANSGWSNSTNNWNQVCLCGMALGALALAEEQPELAKFHLELARTRNINGLKVYAPDGVYPEGAMYWGYGTSFQAILLSALQSALGTDWELSKAPGLLPSAAALLQQLGPTGLYFNFSDNTERTALEPALFWFAQATAQPNLLHEEMARIKVYANSTQAPKPESQNDRILPLAALWWPAAPLTNQTTRPLHWLGRGPNPLAVFRSAWNDPQAMFLALKGGKAALSHGHMDAGSFVFEAKGVRWARDLGMQNYYSLESQGINLWDGAQNGQRWKVFRLGPFCHNVLTIDGQLHRVDGNAEITKFKEGANAGAELDLSPVFKDQAAKVTRRFDFEPGKYAQVRDELEGVAPGALVRWAMLTKAEIAIAENGREATLREAGQSLRVQLQASVAAKFEIASAQGPAPTDAPNPGYSLLIVNLKAPETGKIDATVTLHVA